MNYQDINKKFKKYKLKSNKDSIKKICQPKKFKLQPSQAFLGDFFNSKGSPKGLLVYHKIGAGKTCAAINMAEILKRKMNIMIVLPAALIGSFKNELRSECPGDIYITKKNRKKLLKLKPKMEEYKKIITRTNKKIDKYYKIYSYHKFVDLGQQNKIKLKNTLLIVDEVQNMVSESGTFYKTLKSIIYKADDKTRIVLLSATPMFDKPVEIALTLNLLRPEEQLPVGIKFNQQFLKIRENKDGIYYKSKNLNKFKGMIKNMISYYRGAPIQSFPEEYFHQVRCKMNEFQWKSYLTALSSEEGYRRGSFRTGDIFKLPSNFFLGPRMISNVAYPNKSIGATGFSSFRGDKLQINNISEYSIKFYKIYKRINESEGPVFVYSNFKEYGGIKPFIKFIKKHKWKDYKTHGEGQKRFAVWTGDEHHHVKEEIKFIFNQKENHNGSKIKIMLGSPSIKEGVSLLRVEQVHILEPYWNMSRMLQIMGRAIRYCSHKDIAVRRQFVDVYLYLATYPGEKTVDQYIWSMAKKKNKLISQFEKALKEMAVDCKLFYARNVYKDEDPLICYN